MPRYQKLGIIKKKRGISLYEYIFNESLLNEAITEVFVQKRVKSKKRLPSQPKDAADGFRECPKCGQLDMRVICQACGAHL